MTNGVTVKPSITRGVCPAYGMSRDRLAATGSVFGGGKFFRLDKKPSAQLLIGIAGGISSYGLRGGAALLSIGRGTNHPNSHHSRGHYANIASHEVLPVLLLTRSLPTGACGAVFPGPTQYAPIRGPLLIPPELNATGHVGNHHFGLLKIDFARLAVLS